jgi:hypothetical protein
MFKKMAGMEANLRRIELVVGEVVFVVVVVVAVVVITGVVSDEGVMAGSSVFGAPGGWCFMRKYE